VILVKIGKIAWFFIIELHDFSYQISLPLLFVCLSGVVLFSFCDDHLFGGSRCGCSVKGDSGG